MHGDHHIHGAEVIRLYTRAKAITTHWPEEGSIGGSMHFPTASQEPILFLADLRNSIDVYEAMQNLRPR